MFIRASSRIPRRPDESGYESIVWRVSPSTPPFTDKQGQYLAFIHAYSRIFRQPPAEADMQRHFQVSPPSVHQMVLTLERAGLLILADPRRRAQRSRFRSSPRTSQSSVELQPVKTSVRGTSRLLKKSAAWGRNREHNGIQRSSERNRTAAEMRFSTPCSHVRSQWLCAQLVGLAVPRRLILVMPTAGGGA